MREFQGHYSASGMRFGIIVAKFNEIITKNLLAGAIDAIVRHGGALEDIVVSWVPGAFEIPLVADQLASSKNYDALICLGAVIRGATTHFDYVAGQATSGIAQSTLKHGLPILFGVLTCDNIEQAIERAGSKSGNKGFECAMSAIEMVDLLRQIKAHKSIMDK